jgi:Immunity protein 50
MSLNAISNPEAITSVYEDPAILDRVVLNRLTLAEREPFAAVHVLVNSKPAKVPPRWNKKVNATAIQLDLIGLLSISLSGWMPHKPLGIKMTKDNNGLVTLAADDGSLHIVCQFVRVAHINGYIRTMEGAGGVHA